MPRPGVGPNARGIAARVLSRVWDDAAYAAAVLDAELSRHPQLDQRERGLATELVYGVLRTERALERRVSRFASRGVKDPIARRELLLAAYQILLLDRVPAFAAVDAAVEAVRRERGQKLAGFVNAVLRKLAASGERLSPAAAIRESAPDWLVERLAPAIGEGEMLALLGAGPAGPEVGVRLVGNREPPDWLLRAPAGKLAPGARKLERLSDPRKLAGYADGAFAIQEEGAQAVAHLLGARPGERVLDACAGRGQKTAILREAVGASGSLWASDVHPKKLEALEREFARLGLALPERRALDWTRGYADVPADFDRVLVDAPCSGVGTLRHRPEILLRLGPEDPARLSGLAETILRAAASRARPGGRVLFAVCSVLPEEGEALVDRVADVLEPAVFDAPAMTDLMSEARSSLRLLPLRHGSDGYFVASFTRRGSG